MTLSEFVKNYRTHHDLSQRQFASLCGLSNGYISMVERGINPGTNLPITPTLPALNALARGMNMGLTDLLIAVDDMPVDLCEDEKPEPDAFPLNAEERAVVIAYRCQPEMQDAVCRLLGVTRSVVEEKNA